MVSQFLKLGNDKNKMNFEMWNDENRLMELGDHSVPEGWVQTPKTNTTTGTTAGAPIVWNDPANPEDATAGYGYIADDTTDVEDIYYFHSDHLGSTSYVTDKKGNVTQYEAYLPYGELLVDEHSSSEDMPYKFNGKEMDEETGLYYYGARYYDPKTSIWLGLDPKLNKYPMLSSYNYCADNPINFIDPDGKKILGLLINSRNQIVFTRKVTNDVRRIANVLMLTPEGTKMLKGAIRSNIQIKMKISPDINITHYKTGKLDYIYGGTIQGNFNSRDNYARYVKKDGTYGISQATVTIYEGTISEDLKTSDSQYSGLTLEQAIGAVAGHELVHASDDVEISKDVKYELQHHGDERSDKEIKARRVEKLIIEQQKEQNEKDK